MKKIIIGIILLVIGCIFIAGCASTAPVKDPIAITYYYSPTCGYCAKMSADFDKLAQTHGGEFILTKYDINKEAFKFRDDITRYNSDAVVPFVIIGNRTFSGWSYSTYSDIEYMVINRNLSHE